MGPPACARDCTKGPASHGPGAHATSSSGGLSSLLRGRIGSQLLRGSSPGHDEQQGPHGRYTKGRQRQIVDDGAPFGHAHQQNPSYDGYEGY